MKYKGGSFVDQEWIKFKGAYTIGSVIGQGLFTEVRHCRNILSGSVKAVKIYKKEMMNDYQVSRLENEIAFSK